MTVIYTEKGREIDYRRIDRISSFSAASFFKPDGSSLIYFRLDRYNLKTLSMEDILEIRF